MTRFRSVVNTVNLLTGATSRHNKALRGLHDWVDAVRDFLSVYRLYEQPGAYMLEKSGDAKFDLTSMIYKARSLPVVVKNIKAEGLEDCFAEVTEALEVLRRVLMNQTLQASKLGESSSRLLESFEKLRDKLADVDFM